LRQLRQHRGGNAQLACDLAQRPTAAHQQGYRFLLVPVLARKPGALRNGTPFKDWSLPASLERTSRKLKGSDDGDRQMVKILSAVLTDGLAAVEAACAEALNAGVHWADVILNNLARRRDPPPTATILTPDALRLRHAPIADCARYDSLRRALYWNAPMSPS
jgi:hypothetical protein